MLFALVYYLVGLAFAIIVTSACLAYLITTGQTTLRTILWGKLIVDVAFWPRMLWRFIVES